MPRLQWTRRRFDGFANAVSIKWIVSSNRSFNRTSSRSSNCKCKYLILSGNTHWCSTDILMICVSFKSRITFQLVAWCPVPWKENNVCVMRASCFSKWKFYQDKVDCREQLTDRLWGIFLDRLSNEYPIEYKEMEIMFEILRNHRSISNMISNWALKIDS